MTTETTITATTTSETTVATTENNALVYMDRYGFLHTSREEALEANNNNWFSSQKYNDRRLYFLSSTPYIAYQKNYFLLNKLNKKSWIYYTRPSPYLKTPKIPISKIQKCHFIIWPLRFSMLHAGNYRGLEHLQT